MNGCSATATSDGERIASLAFLSQKFSNITSEQLEPMLCLEIRQYEGNKFDLIATKTRSTRRVHTPAKEYNTWQGSVLPR